MSTQDTEKLRAWIGRREARSDVAAAWPVVALSATFDRSDPEPKPGLLVTRLDAQFLDAVPCGPDGQPLTPTAAPAAAPTTPEVKH